MTGMLLLCSAQIYAAQPKFTITPPIRHGDGHVTAE